MRRKKTANGNMFSALGEDLAHKSGASEGNGDFPPLQIIRTETVISRLPVHNLAKTGEIKINIQRKGQSGKSDLVWEVKHSSGQPRQLAYKLDTLVINQRIDEAGKDVPKRLRLGSLSEICADLGVTASGKTREAIKQALIQNAGSFIKAQLTYFGADGVEYHLTSYFNRYNVHFAGQRFPSGERADAVYISFSDEYYNVLKRAKRRPLDFNYLKKLPPAAQRFYEIISYQMFAAFMNKAPRAQLLYSEYTTFSAQQRYDNYAQFAKQMYKVHQPHVASGYIEEVAYFPTTDAEGRKDWIMSYKPGPKAQAEFLNFNKNRTSIADPATAPEAGVQPTAQQETSEASGSAAKDLVAAAERLVQQFLTDRFGRISRAPIASEIRHARHLIELYGYEQASHVVGYGVKQARKDNYLVRYLNGLMGYLNEGLEDYQRQAQGQLQAEEHAQAVDAAATQRAAAYALELDAQRRAEEKFASLPPDEYARLKEQVRARIKERCPNAIELWDRETWDRTIRANIISILLAQEEQTV